MSTVIEEIKDNALSFAQLKDLVGPNQARNCEWITYDELQKFSNLEQLLHLGAAVILLQIETRNAPRVGHFIVILDHGSHYEHFDSYGLNMDQETAITQEHHLSKLFRITRKRIVSNVKKLQTLRADVNTCGRWVVARLLLRHVELEQFLRLIAFFHVNPDDLVSIMTMLLQFKN